jgi:hypothetical protein
MELLSLNEMLRIRQKTRSVFVWLQEKTHEV